ncbi:MAG: DUF4139 domain-containing protein, partial [Myxococcales bacterium]|nr:DUF4139 domain-containing protein [Myxococcales bacterium]
LRIGLAGDGARDLRISYVTELPGFRPTYRLVVQDDDSVHVQGLAVVDNPTSETWSDVGLTLSTEVPLSFRFDVRTARVANRPAFGPDGHLIRQALPSELTNVLRQNAVGANEINQAYGRAQAGQPEMSNRAGRLVGEDPSPVPAPTNGGVSNALLAFEERPSSSEGAFAEMHGFDLGGHESGLVPFVDTNTQGRMALLFKPAQGGPLSAEHPYRAVLFRNPSDAPLVTGPVSIFAGDRFVGDGVTGTVAAGAHAFVPYALERAVHVAEETAQVEDEVRGTQLNGGMLTVELRAVTRHRFDITSTQALDRPLYVYAAAVEGFEPRELPTGAIQTTRGYFLPATLSASGEATVTFDQVRRRTLRVNVASDPDHAYVPALLALLDGRPETARLREIQNRLVAIEEELDTLAEDLNVERAALSERREALDALHGVSGGNDVRARLSRGVAENVARVDGLARRASALHDEQIRLEQEWYARLRAME